MKVLPELLEIISQEVRKLRMYLNVLSLGYIVSADNSVDAKSKRKGLCTQNVSIFCGNALVRKERESADQLTICMSVSCPF